VNAISAGPVRTVAARSIAGFGDMFSEAGSLSMLQRNITQEEIGGIAMALLTDLGGGVTGQTVYVDAGFSSIGMFLREDQG
jgi:enoyl-[acyl-carrier protein] reductase I